MVLEVGEVYKRFLCTMEATPEDITHPQYIAAPLNKECQGNPEN
jgi:hypothetical protein